MFLIHGIRRIELSSHTLPNPCEVCEEVGSVQLLVLQPYVHLFWLPLFPLPRRGRTKCEICGCEVKHGQLPLQIKLLFGDLKNIGRTPLWTFSGTAILAVVLPLFVQTMSRHSDKQAALLEEPKAGDIWTIKLGPKHYTLYKVEDVRPDSIFLRMNARELHGGFVALARFESDSENDYTGDWIGYARSQLREFEKHGPLHSISRPRQERPSGEARTP